MTLTPNPSSPFATAAADVRHILPTVTFFGAPRPGALVLTSCDRLAVVPTEPLTETNPTTSTPDGLCPSCVAAMNGVSEQPAEPSRRCSECTATTRHDGLCVLCRMEAHDEWWAQQQAETTP
ncbi:hypothetical protein ACIOD1_12815 [Streptomyces sp. NPDC088097]|uniref:hypothetical protein n=1 Tax=Streptomyces sp. NPDC088097 TaxID=3365823 RepID=UPI0037F7AEE9